MVSEFKFFWGITKNGRVLRVDWRPELSEDLHNDFALNAADELSRMLSEEISREIDNQVINELRRTLIGEDNQRA